MSTAIKTAGASGAPAAEIADWGKTAGSQKFIKLLRA